MRKLLILLLMICVSRSRSLAAENANLRPSWAWSVDERISARLDPASVKERLDVHLQRRPVQSDGVAASPNRPSDSIKFVIDGARNPELFMPYELVERFMNVANAGDPEGSSARRLFARELAAFGWESSVFWSEIDRLASDYAAVRKGIARIERQVDAGTVAERREGLEARHAAADRLCFARADALRRARARFGVEAFDRFLYTAVAPKLVVYSDDPMNAMQLREIESGCR